jgi:hypothetical protein
MPPPENDLRFLAAGVDQLESYLLSNEIYWPIGARAPSVDPPFPPLTLGNLLLARGRLRASTTSPAQGAELNSLERQLEAIRQKWRTAWENKASAEFSARLTLWRNYMAEYRLSPGENHDRYAYEVSRRVLLALLSDEAQEIPAAEKELLLSLDAMLKGVFKAGPFVWDENLQPCFPEAAYWYLYGKLAEDYF